MTRKIATTKGKGKNRTRNSMNLGSSPKVSSQTMQILKQFWKSICEMKTQPLPEIVDLEDTDLKNIRNAAMYSSIPEKIRHEFESTSQSGIKTNLVLSSGQQFNIYFAIPSQKNNQHNLETYMTNVVAWLRFFSQIASSKCAQTLNIYLLLTDSMKVIPDLDDEQVDRIHANTAFTTPCSSANDIFLFRREEWFKVFIHETFHCFGLDFSAYNDNNMANQHILSLFPIIKPNTDIRLFETFCEMWAVIFHLVFCLFSASNDKYRCKSFSRSVYNRFLFREQLFSIYQSNKILHRSGYKYTDITKNTSEPVYSEKTQAFSYYVIKSMMLWNLDKFVKWCSRYATKREDETNPPIQFNPEHIAEYCDFVTELSRDDRTYRQFSERINNKPPFKMANIKQTLRMTAIDPEWYE